MDETLLIKSIHKALDTYPVQVWNGSDAPVEKTLATAITSISYDVKLLKTATREAQTTLDIQSELLIGLKKRHEIKSYFLGLITRINDYVRLVSLLKWIVFASAVYIALKNLTDLF